MTGAPRSGARWIALLLGIALVASGVVAYALIRVTTPESGGGQDVAASQSSLTASAPVSTTDRATPPAPTTPVADPSAASLGGASSGGASSGGASSGAAGSGAAGSGAAGSADEPSSVDQPSVTVAPSGPVSSEPSASPSAGATSESAAVTTQTSTLDGSGVTLPAAWSGTATITVRVLGDCATRTPSVYSAAPADLALDLTQNEIVAASPTATPHVPVNQPALTLGINTSAVPAVAVYSSAVDEAGAFHRYWQVTLTPQGERTQIRATLLEQAAQGANLNTLTDTETSLQPCEDPGTVGLPRALAAGSTLSGWVTRTAANLTLHATTTDHKRAVTVQISAIRKQ